MSEAARFPRPRPHPSETGLSRRIADLIASIQPLSELAHAVCLAIAEWVGADCVMLGVAEGESLRTFGVFVKGDARTAALPPEMHEAYTRRTSLRAQDAKESYVAIPLRVGGQVGGVLGARRARSAPFLPDEHVMLEGCEPVIAAAIRICADAAEHDILATLATTDALTGVGNRRKFDQTLAAEWNRCARRGASLAIVLLDVDFFKAFNDHYGHPAGDACLERIARACAARVSREGDTFCRYGGEEFVALLPDTEHAGAVVVAEAIRAEVAKLAIPHEQSTLGIVTVSLGAVALIPSDPSNSATIVAQADALLYAAKNAGRNCVVAGEYRSASPSAQRIRGASASPLPEKLSKFYGREREISELRALFGTARLLTIAGPGGVGKTSIALEIARPLAERKQVWFVDLAATSQSDGVAAAICLAAGITCDTADSIGAALAANLDRDGGVIVLDNCEHVVEACAHIAERLLNAVPGLQILATSREPLGIGGEMTYRLPVLSLPPDDEIRANESSRYDATRLFVERAGLSAADGSLSDADACRVARICRRLDGIPLAIELAVPHLKTGSLTDLEAQLAGRFNLLSNENSSVPQRQQTIEALIRWGYELLTADEQCVLADVSALVGAWPLSAATAVDGSLDEFDMLTALEALVDKSLIFVEPVGDEHRYRLLESTREFAAMRLAESGRAEAVRRRLIAHYRNIIANLRDNQAELGAYAVREHVNITAALGYAFDDHLDPAAGIAVILGLNVYWRAAYKHNEAIRWIDRAFEHATPDTPEHRALSQLLVSALIQNHELDRAEQLSLALMDACTRAGDRSGYRKARSTLSGCYFMRGDIALAKEYMLEQLSEPTDDQDLLSGMYSILGGMCALLGDLDEALKHCEKSLGLATTDAVSAMSTVNYVACLLSLRRDSDALSHLDTILNYPEEAVGTYTRVNVLAEYGYGMVLRGNYPEARRNLRMAVALGIRAIRAHRERMIESAVADAALFCAVYAYAQHDDVTALLLLAFIDEQPWHTAFYQLKPFVEERDRLMRAIRAKLGGDEFTRQAAAGKALTLAQLENLVLSL